MPNCNSCGAEIMFMRTRTKSGEMSKLTPIDAKPNREKGNLVISREREEYRFATGNERETAKLHNKNLYVAHFTVCPDADHFRKRDQFKLKR